MQPVDHLFSPEVSNLILGGLVALGTWFATWLARRGKKEDNKITERGQAFDQLADVAETRLAEITRLRGERDAAYTELERVRASWEGRWDRQMDRCRDITSPLVESIATLRIGCTPEAERMIIEALRRLAEHNARDHTPEGY